MKRYFLLFGAGGTLGASAVKYFSKAQYDFSFFFSRRRAEIDLPVNSTHITTGDLTAEEEVSKAFSKIPVDQKAEIFLFSTIGGYTGGKKIHEIDYNEWLGIFNLNLNISFLIAKYFCKAAVRFGGGSICFTSAAAARELRPQNTAYDISKQGLEMMVKILAEEGKEINISANAIAPYALDTEENRSWVENPEMLVSPNSICEKVNWLFENRREITGNIFLLPESKI